MTAPLTPAGQCPRDYTAPALPPEGQPLPIFGDAFSANPHATYTRLRQLHGGIAPVEIAPNVFGYLALSYWLALWMLRNTPNQFAKDPTHHWQALADGTIPDDSPARMMMMPRDNALWKDGPEHFYLRRAITTALARVNSHAFATDVAHTADELIDAFATTGHADLVAQFADPLPMQSMIKLFGCPPDLGTKIVTAIGMLFDGQDAAQANRAVQEACLELTRLKRRHPGRDMTTWLLDTGLTDEQMIQTILLVVGAATTPSSNWIMNGLLRILTDMRFAGNVHNGVQPVSDAMDEVLWWDSPVANYSPLYPIGHQEYHGYVFHTGYPVLISFAAANADPVLALPSGSLRGNRGHLAFSAGVHACPAPGLARTLAQTAMSRILDRLPRLTLATDLPPARRQGTFHSGLTTLPVQFQTAATGR
ncbi:cytochrome P450 [Streptomyces sp. NBC_00838]|uniref:cytochrome P450 n=1 Tax=Streptomyces sp. NBC_00838 TaxID=2903680 RepID=UPI0038708A62|nr:cytochrome P450 [Streptomyces sp. NBC_00838]